MIVDDPLNDPRHAKEIARETGVTPAHLMIAPLVDGEDVIGGIEIIDQRRTKRDGAPWTEADLKLLVLIAAQAASAIGLARRRSEQSKSDRLASIGRMLAGLLHDLKTPMTIISGYAQLMAGVRRGAAARAVRRADPAPVRSDGGHDARGARVRARRDRPRRAQGLRQPVHRGPDDAARRGDVGPRHRASRSTRGYDGIAYFDEQKLLRVFHNLARNAVEAMPEGGHLRVTRRHATATSCCWRSRDTGPGIPAECAAGCSSCSRPASKGGTGLGLAIVKKIVDDHRGRSSSTAAPEVRPSRSSCPLQRATDGD